MKTHWHCLFVLLFCLVFGVCTAHAVAKGPRDLVRVGIFPAEPLNFIDNEGIAQGFYPDLLEEIVKDGRWRVEYVPGSWAEGLERL